MWHCPGYPLSIVMCAGGSATLGSLLLFTTILGHVKLQSGENKKVMILLTRPKLQILSPGYFQIHLCPSESITGWQWEKLGRKPHLKGRLLLICSILWCKGAV